MTYQKKRQRKQTSAKSIQIGFAGPVYGKKEIDAVVRVLKSKKILPGENVKKFEQSVAKILGKKYGVMVNSGSSANLLAVEILDLKEGSEVITPILTFGTVISPLIQKRLIPVFVDVEMGSYLPRIDHIEQTITKKTKAIMIPSLLGNVPDMKRLQQIAKKHRLFLIEDTCDTLGASFKNKPTGTYSDISTTSFYGAHIITGAGGGGIVCVNSKDWVWKLKAFRGWGRRVSPTTETANINTRYKTKLKGVPYDERFIYDETGYNFMPTEVSAAFGLAQLPRLKTFTRIRTENFNSLLTFFKQYENFFYLPEQTKHVTNNNWLAFPLTLKRDVPFQRLELIKHLEKNNIQILTLFSGNITLHPWMNKVIYRAPFKTYKVADQVTTHGFIIPCHQALGTKEITYMKDTFIDFLDTYV